MTDPKYVRKLLLSLSDEQLMEFLGASSTSNPVKSTKKTSKQNTPIRWFDQDIRALDKDGLLHLEELESEKRRNITRHFEEKQLRYLRTLKDMRLEVPDSFRSITDPKKLYVDLKGFCEENDIPTEIIDRIVPALLEYISTGRLRPVIFVGEKGCGKTTAVKKLVSKALQIPTEVIKIPQTDGSHGITGDCATYQSADCGCMARAILKHNSMIVAYVFDEIDKVPHRFSNQSSVDDELLSITDESNDSIYDDYLEVNINLQYSAMFFTGNKLEDINPILADRCTIIKFPTASADRLKSIARKYVKSKLNSTLFDHIKFDYSLMDNAIDRLVGSNVTSIRKHQQMIEIVLDKCLNIYFNNPNDELVNTTEEMFNDAINAVSETEKRRIGF